MKKFETALYLTLTLTLLNLAFVIFMFSPLHKGQNSKDEFKLDPIAEDLSHFDNKFAEITEMPLAYTTDVKVPERISFASEEVPLHRIDVVESFRKELIVNTYLHSHSLQIMHKAPRFFAIIEPILKEEGVPDDFKYLAVIESSLYPLAVSPAGAAGIWQFMEGAAREFNLEVGRGIDERYNLEKATRAATRYLKKAYEHFGSWTTTAAAYNAGRGQLNKRLADQKVTNYYDLMLNEETGRYVFRILALKQIMTHPQLYNFSVQDTYPIEETTRVQVNTSIGNLVDFAKEHHISLKTLKRFNPWLRENDLKNPLRKSYEILIPVHTHLYE
ncbi:murein transglycosylase [Bacteroidia bacterium]|nr:murein transglycosylase [Bacteroidia bacterium]